MARITMKRVVLALLLAAVLIAGVGALSFFRSSRHDKVYAGKRLSEHLISAFGSVTSPNMDAAASDSRAIFLDAGTNCIPLLEEWLRVRTPVDCFRCVALGKIMLD